MALKFLNNGYFAGKVGIGTESPAARLHINPTTPNEIAIAINGTQDYSAGQFHRIAAGDSNSINRLAIGFGYDNPTDWAIRYSSYGRHEFYTGNDWGNAANTEKMVITSAGDVGIGTGSPDAKLSVTSATLNSEDILYLKSGADNVNDYLGIAWELGVGGNGPHSAIRSFAGPSGSDARLGFLTTSDGGTTLTEGLSVAHNSNVGIGVTSPTAKLTLADHTTAAGGIKFRTASSSVSLYSKSSGNLNSVGSINSSSRFRLLGGNGVSDPDYGFRYEDGYGMGFSRAGNDIIFVTNSAEQMRLDNNGNVGIGTTSPQSILHVAGTQSYGSLRLTPTSANGESAMAFFLDTAGTQTSNAWVVGHAGWGNTGDFVIGNQQFGGPIMLIQQDGNVGIGTTSPTADLSVGSTTTSSGDVHLRTTKTTFSITPSNTNAGGILLDLGWVNGGQGPMKFGIGGAEKMRITAGGNVGIGITSPGDKLHVEGGIIIQNGNNLQWGGLYSAGAPTIYASTNYLHFVPTGTTGSGYRQMRLDIIGLGIGTSSPSEKLDVAGNIKIQAALLSNQENTDVDTGTETVASVVIATYTAAFFDFVIKKTTNVRSGTVYACHDGTNVEFTETSTQDLGDTSDVTLSVDISGGNMRLRATTTSDNWSVKSLIRAI
jgi:hypothetical protein